MEENNNSLRQLQEIRRIMERSTRFLSLSGLSGISAGLVALLGAWVADWHLGHRDSIPERVITGDFRFLTQARPHLFFFGLAFLVLALSIFCAFYFTWRKSRKKGERLISPVGLRFLTHLSIPLVAGALFSVVLIGHGYWSLLAPALLIFYGLALVNGSKYTFGDIFYLGILEIVLGFAAALIPGHGLLFWSAGFGFLHIIYGIFLWNKYEKKDHLSTNH